MKLHAILRPFGTYSFFYLLIFTLLACKEKPMLQPVETNAKVAPHQEPTFPEQTRVAGIKTKSNFKVTILTEELDLPWGIDQLPDGRFIISEKTGKIRIVSLNGEIEEPLEGVPSVFFKGVTGMMDVKISPDFEKDRLVFWTYMDPIEDGKGENVIARARLSADENSMEEFRIIYRTGQASEDGFHTGSRILFDKDNHLFVTIGDRFTEDVRIQAQEINSPIGKIIRIDKEGNAIPDNPFYNIEGAAKETWSIGHRNPQGLALHPGTGELWVSDHGPRGGDELNRVLKGENYGWPLVSFGIGDDGEPVGSGLTTKEGMQDPVYYWDPAVAPSGMIFYTGSLIKEWKNNLFIGALRGSNIIRLIIDTKENKVLGEERILADEEQRFRHLIQGKDEAIYAITEQGRLYRIGN